MDLGFRMHAERTPNPNSIKWVLGRPIVEGGVSAHFDARPGEDVSPLAARLFDIDGIVGAFFASIYLNLGMTTLQLLVPDHLRGRVMGVWGLTWFLAPAGGFVAASLAEWLGAALAVAIGALAVSGFAMIVYLTSPEVRAIPVREEMTAAG